MSSNQPPERPETPPGVPHGRGRAQFLVYPQVGDIVIYQDRPAIVTGADEELVTLIPVGSSDEVTDVNLGFESGQWRPRIQDVRDSRVTRNVPDDIVLRIRRGTDALE